MGDSKSRGVDVTRSQIRISIRYRFPIPDSVFPIPKRGAATMSNGAIEPACISPRLLHRRRRSGQSIQHRTNNQHPNSDQ
jgi:hypothetical protein